MAEANSYPLRPNYTPMISITMSIVFSDISNDDSVLSGKLSEKAKLT